MAPEVIHNQNEGMQVSYDGRKIDVFNCGIILFILLAGQPPFQSSGDDRHILFEKKSAKRLSKMFSEKLQINIEESAFDLIQHMVKIDPNDRYTMK